MSYTSLVGGEEKNENTYAKCKATHNYVNPFYRCLS